MKFLKQAATDVSEYLTETVQYILFMRRMKRIRKMNQRSLAEIAQIRAQLQHDRDLEKAS